MIEWFKNDTSRIRRVGYDRHVESMYIDFEDSEVDVPYCNVPEELFREFIASNTLFSFYEKHIMNTYEISPHWKEMV
jgi:hypothetical protein